MKLIGNGDLECNVGPLTHCKYTKQPVEDKYDGYDLGTDVWAQKLVKTSCETQEYHEKYQKQISAQQLSAEHLKGGARILDLLHADSVFLEAANQPGL